MTEPMRLRARLHAPAGEVWSALTDASQLRGWLAEHASDTFAFWGRYTPQGEVARQRLLQADEPTLRFAWTLGGQESEVSIQLTGEAGATVVSVSQTWDEGQEVVPGYPANLALVTFWSLAVTHLADHLAGRPALPWCDYTATDLRAEVPIGAPRQVVYDSLVDSESFSQWFGLKVELEPYPGGLWSIPAGGPVGRVLNVEPGVRLWLEEDSGVAAWELADSGEGTLLTFAFTGSDRTLTPYASWTGWLSSIATLRRYHEVSDWQPLWLDA